MIWRWFWGEVWFWSEHFEIPLGRFAPWVFGQILGIKGVRKHDE